ncbi:MAG: hypothetical protein ACR2KT_00065 [Methylocella sp.]
MRYLGAISLTPLGRKARASDHKPVIRSTIERNTILPFSANYFAIVVYSIERYGARTLLFDLAATDNCTEIAEGAWTNITDTQDCGKEKCGKVTTQ